MPRTVDDQTARALPVRVACTGRLRDEVERHVESALGWQVLADGDRWVRPSLVLADGTQASGSVAAPVVLLILDDSDPGAAARTALSTGAAAVVSWPADRGRLPEVVGPLLTTSRPAGSPVLTVAGGTGGVGATTVALALGGIVAWSGGSCLVVVTGDAPVPAAPVVLDDALDSPGLWSAAAHVPGVPGLRVLSRGRAPASAVAQVDLPDEVRVVVDAGVAPSLADVLVVRRDRGGQEAVGDSAAGALVVVDEGPLPERELLARVGSRVVAVVPRSGRVARAGLQRRVPAALPGTWFAPLHGFVAQAG